MAQILQPYELPLIYSDLSPSETLRDALHAIKSLSRTVDEIFTKIDSRLATERQRLGSIHKRVSKCHDKVRQVQGSKKAITVFSTAKFPAAKTLPFYSTLIPDAKEIPSAYREAGDEQYFLAPSKYALVGKPDLHVEVLTLLGRLNSYGTDMERIEFIVEDEGLGTLPDYVPSVGSLLLFNSSINLYKEYQTQDNLISTGRVRLDDEVSKKALASAPMTILSGDALPDIEALDLNFKPIMEEMSTLMLPANLPLDFIADIQYSGIPLPSIAPSQSKGQHNLASQAYSSGPRAKEVKREPALPPPPPPPAAPTQTSFTPPKAEIATMVPVASMPPPPPPPRPPPPPPTVVKPTVSQKDVQEEEEEPLPSMSVPGSSLLDGIKNMDKLRSREESQLLALKYQKKEDAKKPLSLQDDLRARLQRRNGTISGKTEKEQQAKDALIIQEARRNSAMIQQGGKPIPPPLVAAKKTTFLGSVGFSEIAESDNESDGPKLRHGFTKTDAFSDTDSASISDVSIDSVTTPPPPAPAPRQTIVPPTRKPAEPEPVAANERRGSLLDASNATVAGMLNKAKQRMSDSESDDDWD